MPFFLAAKGFVTPQIGVGSDKTGDRFGKGHGRLAHFVIEAGGIGRRLGHRKGA